MLRQNGFSLLEALLAVLILSILTGYSIGGFREFINTSRGESALIELAQSIRLARAAISDNSLVTICRSSDGEHCAGSWTTGSIVFTDQDGNRKLDEEDRLLAINQHPPLQGSLRWRAFRNRQWLQLTPLGFTRYQNGNFTYCPNDGDASKGRQLVVSRTARLRFAKDRDGDGIVENSQGKPLDCS